MSILLTIILLVMAVLALVLPRALRPQFRFGWLIALGLTSLGWLNVLLWQIQMPIRVDLPGWSSLGSLATHPSLLVTGLAWPNALSLITLALAVLLTAPARPGFPGPFHWALSLALITLSLLAVIAGDTVTLVLIWAALDLIELGLALRWADTPVLSERAVTTFAVRLGGILLVVLARVLNPADSQGGSLLAVSAPAGILVVAASALRLGVLPSPLPYNAVPQMRGGLGTSLQLSSAAASLALLSKIPPASLASPWAPVLLVLCAGAGLYAALMWLRAPDIFSGQRFWLVGMASLATASALRGSPSGATAWTAALVLVGATLFLSSVQHRWLNRALVLGAWILSALPFCLTAAAWVPSPAILDWSLPVFLIAQAMLLAGYFHHALRPMARQPADPNQVWVRGVYPLGILSLLLVALVLGVWGWDGAFQMGAPVAGIVVVMLAAASIWAKARVPLLSPVPSAWLPRQSSGVRAWIYRLVSRLFTVGARVSETVAGILEGEAGIMWSVLFLALFVSLIASRKP